MKQKSIIFEISTILFLVVFHFSAFSQYTISAKIIDSHTKDNLVYCNILNLGNKKGCISNEEGKFKIEVNSLKQVLRISYIGYHPLEIQAQHLEKNPLIELSAKSINIQEFIVYADDDYKYELIQKCRKKFKQSKRIHTAKAYYGIQTTSNEKPLEMLECYYNAHMTGQEIRTLNFKAGRTGLAIVDNGYFQSYNTAKAISKLSLLSKSDYYPGNPMQYSKQKMKKLYRLENYVVDSNTMIIRFYPKKQKTELFSGEVWFDRNTYDILKIDLYTSNTVKYPFEAKHQHHSISEVSLKITNTYARKNEFMVIDHINFEYSFLYHSVWGYQDSLALSHKRNVKRNINSKGIIKLYDYDQGFIIPYFEYPDNLYYGDYFRIEFMPYNAIFWDKANQILLTKQQKENLGFFANNGKLTNYWNIEEGFSTLQKTYAFRESNNYKRYFDFQYIYWTPKRRLILKLDQSKQINKEVQNQSSTTKEIPVNLDNGTFKSNSGSTFKSDQYQLKSQLFLDVTRIGDSLYCQTFTVFDTYQSYYSLEKHEYTNAFINIFFDICEIERRKLEDNLAYHSNSLEEINKIYELANLNMIEKTNKYFQEVKAGLNFRELKKWNQYVYENLGIDNLLLVDNTQKYKQ